MKNLSRITLLTVALLSSSCAVGPDFKHPKAPAVTSYTATALPAQTASAPVAGGAAQIFHASQDVPANWWTLFGNPALNKLVEEGLKANPDLQSARAALRQAREIDCVYCLSKIPYAIAQPADRTPAESLHRKHSEGKPAPSSRPHF